MRRWDLKCGQLEVAEHMLLRTGKRPVMKVMASSEDGSSAPGAQGSKRHKVEVCDPCP